MRTPRVVIGALLALALALAAPQLMLAAEGKGASAGPESAGKGEAAAKAIAEYKKTESFRKAKVRADKAREAAESWWLMMAQMSGWAKKSPVIQAMERKGIEPAEMKHLDLSVEGSGHQHGAGSGKAPAVQVWSRQEYISQYNRLGATPPPGGYEKYLARMGVSSGAGEGHEGHHFALDEAEHLKQMASILPGEAKVKRGRNELAPEVRVRVRKMTTAEYRARVQSRRGTSKLASPCEAPTSKEYNVVAIRKDIVYTRFGDHDPEGMLYVLEEDRDRVLACEGFECGHDPLFFGSRSDPNALSPQPLVLRANIGDTVTVNLRNELGDMPASIHIHKALYDADVSAGSVAGFNADSTAQPGESIRYEWTIPDDDSAEGIYYFYSHVDPRFQVPHGLYGALIVQPAGSCYLDTETGLPLSAGWGAIIDNVDTSVRSFREYVVLFQDRIELKNIYGGNLADFYTGVPDAGGKGISLRTAPFFNEMNLFLDESMAYAAYTYGDASTPHPRWYVGDPMRVRILHAGSGEHHVYHNHAHRWRVNPQEVENLDAQGQPTGLVENNLTEVSKGGFLPEAEVPGGFVFDAKDAIFPRSTRIDSQTFGPGEVFDVFMEGGAGGVQRTVGDVLFHCHIIEHVVEGMWSYHRVYNTLQPNLHPLDDALFHPEAVDSTTMLSQETRAVPVTGPFAGQELTNDNILEFLKWLLPPARVPDEELIIDPVHGNRTQNKAHSWDWVIRTEDGEFTVDELLQAKADTGNVPDQIQAMGEPYDIFFGPGFPAEGEGVGAGTPGERPALEFNPIDGRLAFPHLKPHLGRRPPFAPIRNGNTDTQGTAYLGINLPRSSPHWPSGAPRGSGLVPEDDQGRISRVSYDIVAMETPIQYSNFGDMDPKGMIFALRDDMPKIRNYARRMIDGDLSIPIEDTRPPEPLIVRSNVHQVVQIRLQSAQSDLKEMDFHAKVGMHIHLVQYDVQSSDGAVAGLNYETSVRPSLDADGNPIQGRRACGVWDPRDCGPLDMSDEVIHTTWFSDTELGVCYWHDHSKLIVTLPHGLFAALIVEPQESEWRDQQTGEPKYVANLNPSTSPLVVGDAGPSGDSRPCDFAEMQTNQDCRYSSTNGITGTQVADIVVPDGVIDPRTGEKRASFREFFFGSNDATQLMGERIFFNALNHGESRRNPEVGWANFNLRLEPFVNRLEVTNPDDSLVYSSFIHGDPMTTTYRSYVGDPVSLRIEGGATSSIHILNLHGHRWDFQRGDPTSSVQRSFVVIGVSEGFTFDLDAGAGGTNGYPGDYLYFNGNGDHHSEGMWGLFRVHDTLQMDLQPLPDRVKPPEGIGFPENMIAAFEAQQDKTRPPAGPATVDLQGNPAPDGAPIREYDVVAIEQFIPYDSEGTGDINGRLFVLAEHVDDVIAGRRATEPLVMRANVGELVRINLTNRTGARVGMHAQMVTYNPFEADGAAVGYNPDTTVAPGENRTYQWYADEQLGTVYLYNPANIDHTRHGLFGALVVEPENSIWRSPIPGDDSEPGWRADVIPGDGSAPFREFVIFFHDGQDQLRYRVAVNYRSARRMGANEVLIGGPGGVVRSNREDTVHSSVVWGDPVTPIMQAYEGDRVIVRHLQPTFEDHHVFHLHGHSWFLEPGDDTSQRLSNITDSVGSTYDLELIGGARRGDHLYHCHIQDHKVMGMWGMLRVFAADDVQADLGVLPAGALSQKKPDAATARASEEDEDEDRQR